MKTDSTLAVRALQGLGASNLSGSVSTGSLGLISPYFHMIDTREEAPDRDIYSFPSLMATNRAFIEKVFDYDDINLEYGVWVTYMDSDGVVTQQGKITAAIAGMTDRDSFRSTIVDAVVNASPDTITTAEVFWIDLDPQPAIADAPADAVTNYNTVTTLLGTLTGAVNDANTKQNQIATQLNTLLSELRTLGVIAS